MYARVFSRARAAQMVSTLLRRRVRGERRDAGAPGGAGGAHGRRRRRRWWCWYCFRRTCVDDYTRACGCRVIGAGRRCTRGRTRSGWCIICARLARGRATLAGGGGGVPLGGRGARFDIGARDGARRVRRCRCARVRRGYHRQHECHAIPAPRGAPNRRAAPSKNHTSSLAVDGLNDSRARTTPQRSSSISVYSSFASPTTSSPQNGVSMPSFPSSASRRRARRPSSPSSPIRPRRARHHAWYVLNFKDEYPRHRTPSSLASSLSRAPEIRHLFSQNKTSNVAASVSRRLG